MDTETNPTPEQEIPPQDEEPRRGGARVLREWGFDVDQFRSRAKVSLDEARGDLSEVTKVVKQTLADTKQVLLELQRNRTPVATELKGGFERAWDEIERAFKAARQRMREEPAPQTSEPSQPQPPPDTP